MPVLDELKRLEDDRDPSTAAACLRRASGATSLYISTSADPRYPTLDPSPQLPDSHIVVDSGALFAQTLRPPYPHPQSLPTRGGKLRRSSSRALAVSAKLQFPSPCGEGLRVGVCSRRRTGRCVNAVACVGRDQGWGMRRDRRLSSKMATAARTWISSDLGFSSATFSHSKGKRMAPTTSAPGDDDAVGSVLGDGHLGEAGAQRRLARSRPRLRPCKAAAATRRR